LSKVSSVAFGERSTTQVSLPSRAAPPTQYSTRLLESAGITDLIELNRVFLSDPGRELSVRRGENGSGLHFGVLDRATIIRGSWLMVEAQSFPGEEQSLRARVFKTFQGAVAEFAVRLRLYPEGEVSLSPDFGPVGGEGVTLCSRGITLSIAPFDARLGGGSSTC